MKLVEEFSLPDDIPDSTGNDPTHGRVLLSLVVLGKLAFLVNNSTQDSKSVVFKQLFGSKFLTGKILVQLKICFVIVQHGLSTKIFDRMQQLGS